MNQLSSFGGEPSDITNPSSKRSRNRQPPVENEHTSTSRPTVLARRTQSLRRTTDMADMQSPASMHSGHSRSVDNHQRASYNSPTDNGEFNRHGLTDFRYTHPAPVIPNPNETQDLRYPLSSNIRAPVGLPQVHTRVENASGASNTQSTRHSHQVSYNTQNTSHAPSLLPHVSYLPNNGLMDPPLPVHTGTDSLYQDGLWPQGPPQSGLEHDTMALWSHAPIGFE